VCSRFSVTVEVVGSIFIFFLMRFVFSVAETTEKDVCVSQIRFEDEKPKCDTQIYLSVVSAKEKTNLIRKKMNIDPTTSTVTEKREHTCLILSDFRHRFQKPKSHSRGCAKSRFPGLKVKTRKGKTGKKTMRSLHER
jgi:hypothetical protein